MATRESELHPVAHLVWKASTSVLDEEVMRRLETCLLEHAHDPELSKGICELWLLVHEFNAVGREDEAMAIVCLIGRVAPKLAAVRPSPESQSDRAEHAATQFSKLVGGLPAEKSKMCAPGLPPPNRRSVVTSPSKKFRRHVRIAD